MTCAKCGKKGGRHYSFMYGYTYVNEIYKILPTQQCRFKFAGRKYVEICDSCILNYRLSEPIRGLVFSIICGGLIYLIWNYLLRNVEFLGDFLVFCLCIVALFGIIELLSLHSRLFPSDHDLINYGEEVAMHQMAPELHKQGYDYFQPDHSNYGIPDRWM